jgi:transposase
VNEIVEARDRELIYRPPYSPDLNPIDVTFAKLKALVWKAVSRTREALIEAMSLALEAERASDARGFLEPRAYNLLAQPLWQTLYSGTHKG